VTNVNIIVGCTQGRREGGSRGVKCPPSPPKNSIYFRNFFSKILVAPSQKLI
jgi:hypothetical protein